MKKILFILAFLIAAAAFSQVIPVDVLNRNGLTTAQMNSVTVADGLVEGSEIRNTDTGTIWRYNGTIWEDTGGGGSSYTFTSPIEENAGTVSLNMSAFDFTQILTTYPNLDTDSTDDFTEADADAKYLQSFTETDPIFTASDAFPITSAQISQWVEAHSWGDHSLAGYLSSATDFVDLTTNQNIGGNKTFLSGLRGNGHMFLNFDNDASGGDMIFYDDNTPFGSSNNIANKIFFHENNLSWMTQDNGYAPYEGARLIQNNTAIRDYTFPDKDGTVAMLSDIGGGGSLTTEQTERIANANRFDPNIKTADNIPWASDDVEKQSVGDRGTRSAYSITNGATYTAPMTDAFIALQLAANLPLLSAPFDGTAINTLEVGTIYQFKDFAGNTGDVWTVTNDVKSGVIIGTDIYVDGGTVSTASTVPELFVTANAASDPNGNETDGTAGWTGIGASVASESTDADLNGFTIVITANQNDGNDMGRYTQTGLDPAKTYVLEFRAKRTGTDSSLQLLAAELDGSQILTSINSATYTDYSVEFDPSGTSIDFRFAVNLQNGIGNIGDVLKVSQISLKEKVN